MVSRLMSIKVRVPSELEHVQIVKFEYRALRAPPKWDPSERESSMLGARPTPIIARIVLIKVVLIKDLLYLAATKPKPNLNLT